MAHNHLNIYHRAWSQLGPPLRPPPDVVAAIREQIKDRPGRALLLGVTPELAAIAPDLVAVDRNFSMVVHVWPGNTASRCAIVADWLKSNFKTGTFSVCVGDGSLSFLEFPEGTAGLLHELQRVLKAGARVVIRVYLPGDPPEAIAALREEAMAGEIDNFHAFKIRLAMSLAGRKSVPHVRVVEILEAFSSLFRDREELSRATQWSREQIDTIDFYRDSNVSFAFPSQDQLLSVVSRICPGVRLVPSGHYEMSRRCPLLVADML